MPRVVLTGSICQHVGGMSAVDVEGSTVRAAVAALEAAYPGLRGWIADERGVLRRHVKVFLRQETVALDAAIGPDDELHIVAAISGG
ncbi:MAG: MoaD/ThiS family protein [Hyphomicrobiaceae bacterium]|nr:MAG: MoaD/ThiS family protein [Hyphomicrobiaceae bacterium]